MAVITTYVCDVSGVSGTNKEDFISVEIKSYDYCATSYANSGYSSSNAVTISKLISKSVANKLGLNRPPKVVEENPQPEVTFESKLSTLLTDYINGLVYDEVQAAKNN